GAVVEAGDGLQRDAHRVDLGEVVAAAAHRAHDLVDVDRLALAAAFGHGHGRASGLRRGQAVVVLGGCGAGGGVGGGGFDLHVSVDSQRSVKGMRRRSSGTGANGCGEVCGLSEAPGPAFSCRPAEAKKTPGKLPFPLCYVAPWLLITAAKSSSGIPPCGWSPDCSSSLAQPQW